MVSFVMMLIIFFVSPLYFLLKGKWIGFVGNLILYILALFTILIFGIGTIFWLFGVLHAALDYRKEEAEEMTTKLADKIAKANARERERTEEKSKERTSMEEEK